MLLVSMTTVANFSTSFASVVDTSGKFSPVSLTPVKICHRCQRRRWQTMGTIIKLLTTLNELEKNVSICQLYYPKVSKRNNKKIFRLKIFSICQNIHLEALPTTDVHPDLNGRLSEQRWNHTEQNSVNFQ